MLKIPQKNTDICTMPGTIGHYADLQNYGHYARHYARAPLQLLHLKGYECLFELFMKKMAFWWLMEFMEANIVVYGK